MRELWDRLRAAFDNLSGRERALVSAAGGLLAVALLIATVAMPIRDARQRVRQRLTAAEQQLEAMTRLRREFDDVQHRLSLVEQRIQRGARGNLRTTLETLARRATVRVESMEPQASPANDRYREAKVEVGLAGVTLAQVVKYLHEIEAASQVMSVKSLRMRARADAPELLDVRFTVSSFEPL